MGNSEGHVGAFGSEVGAVVDLNDLGFKSRWGQPRNQARLDATEEENPSASAQLTETDESNDSPRRDAGRSDQREYQRRWIASRRARFFSGKSCAACGATEALELDHLDPSQKEDHRIWSWSDDRRAAEIAKCRVLCSTCHRTRHADERRKALVHGTANAYKKRACRCDRCRAWNASYKASLKGRPGEAIGRALICAFGLALLAGLFSGCETKESATARCLRLCAGAVHELDTDPIFAARCVCEPGCPDSPPSDGGRP